MTWVSHKLLTGTILFAITGDIVIAGCGAAGAIIPDSIEGFPDPASETAQKSWRKNHRQLSHYFPFYLLVFLITWGFLYRQGITPIGSNNIMPLFNSDVFWPSVITYIISFASLGALFHILEDAICGTVPGFVPQQRWGIQLFMVGSLKEYTIVFLLSFFLGLTRII